MERRTFLRSGVAAGLAGTGMAGLLPELISPTALRSPALRAKRGAHLRLNRNENPLGLSELARKTIIGDLDEANRYPMEPRKKLIEALAAKHGVKVEQIVLGTGSTEVLQMVVQSVGPGATVLVAEPTFEDVPEYAEDVGLKVEKIPLRADHAHDLERMRARAMGLSGPVLVYICNPNNPTATITPAAEVSAWIQDAPERITFAVDEAYFEYADSPHYASALQWIATRTNVVIVRTFSKIHAMAGMRLGYGIAHPDMAARLGRYASQTNANHLVLVAALASLNDRTFAQKSIALNREGRDILYKSLDDLGLEYLPSQANFVMHRIQGDLTAYINRMLERNIEVGRPFPPMLTYNRISIGLPDEMRAFTEELRSFRQQGWV